MEKRIWKFELEVTDKQFISMPKEAELLTVQTQNQPLYEKPCLWALINPINDWEERCFEIFGTGHPIHYDMGIERKYIGTFQVNCSNLVFHVFERL
jgi:hypothetical protein